MHTNSAMRHDRNATACELRGMFVQHTLTKPRVQPDGVFYDADDSSVWFAPRDRELAEIVVERYQYAPFRSGARQDRFISRVAS